MESNPWIETVSQREKEILAVAAMEHGTKWVDASQQITRARFSQKDSAPTVLPSCHLYSFEAGRFLVGRDLMRLQGFPLEALPNPSQASDRQLQDLAGNSFAVPCSMALDIAVLLSVKGSGSETEAEPVCHFLHDMGGVSSEVSQRFEFEI